MKLLIFIVLFSFKSFSSDLNIKFEIVNFVGQDKRYFDFFEIKDGVLFTQTQEMRREMGVVNCAANICSGGPFLNDYDMPEILSIVIVLDDPEGIKALVFATWDEEQVFQLKSIR